jgi:hypothetical protein
MKKEKSMKFSPSVMGLFLLIFGLSSSLFAQQKNGAANILARGCKAISLEFGWQDGQAVSLKKVQKIIRTMTLPKDYTISPKAAIDELKNMNTKEVTEVVFNCTSDAENVEPNTVARFYFSFLLPDNTLERTPELVVKKKVAP